MNTPITTDLIKTILKYVWKDKRPNLAKNSIK